MKCFTHFTGAVCLTLTLLAAVPAVSASEKKLAVTANSTNSFEVTGMTCNGCAKGIASELRRTPGVATATVTFTNKLAVVAIDTNLVSSQTLLKTIEEAGYKAKSTN